jgi:predicted HTH domain antitoxin
MAAQELELNARVKAGLLRSKADAVAEALRLLFATWAMIWFLAPRARKAVRMHTLILEMPQDVASALRVPPAEQAPRLRQELAIRLYEKGLLSFGKARELAGLSKWEFHILLGSEGVERTYDAEELLEDLAALERYP